MVSHLPVPIDGRECSPYAVDAAGRSGRDPVVMAAHGRGAFGELPCGARSRKVITRGQLPVPR